MTFIQWIDKEIQGHQIAMESADDISAVMASTKKDPSKPDQMVSGMMEVMKKKDEVLFHKGAISALVDVKEKVIKLAKEQSK